NDSSKSSDLSQSSGSSPSSSDVDAESNKTNDEKIWNKVYEMFEQLSTEYLEMFDNNPDKIVHLIKTVATHRKKVSSSETNGQ
ncbi:2392_t:CDS:2, partial [Racocetra persica]